MELNVNEIAAQFDISKSEAKRIDAVVYTFDGFVVVWESESWWRDESQPAIKEAKA